MRRIALVSLAALAVAACGNNAEEGSSSSTPSSVAGSADLAPFNLASPGEGVTVASTDIDGGLATLTDVVLAAPDGGSVTIGTLTMVSPGGTANAPEVQAVTMENVVFAAEDAAVNVGTITLEEPSPAIAGLVAKLFERGDVEAPEFGSAADYGFKTFSLENVSLTPPADAEVQIETFGIDRIAFTDASAESVGAMTMAGLSIVGELDQGPMNVQFGEFSLRGLSLQGLVDVIDAAVAEDEDAVTTALTTAAFTDPYRQAFDRMELKDLNANIAGLVVNMPGSVTEQRMDGGKLRQVETSQPLTIKAVSADGALGAQAATFLGMVGYNDGLEFTGSAEYTGDPATDRFMIDRYEFAMTDGFKLSMNGDFGGVKEYVAALQEMNAMTFASLAEGDFADEDETNAMALEALQNLTIHGFSFTLEDDSLLERGLTLASTFTGESVDSLKAQVSGGAAMAPMFTPEGPLQGFAAQAAAAAAAFVNEGGSLTITFTGEEPFEASSLAALAEGGEGAPETVPFAVTHTAP